MLMEDPQPTLQPTPAARDPWCTKYYTQYMTDSALHIALTWARNFQTCFRPHGEASQSIERAVQWEKPLAGWICVNTYGAAANGCLRSAAGGSMRDCEGNWLWGMFTGLSIAWGQGYEKIFFNPIALLL
ncbi:uncharacterized protein LOC120190372 [Hibiscus syriacus]|uniref:uncharacterized protein LOC120190372 n=1 Tax=Hibiscus syriacus TaxID=106335 RepID=UPI001924D345|nr:uncharacterized protein LOC120190372 [Hibiscus syriacus]